MIPAMATFRALLVTQASDSNPREVHVAFTDLDREQLPPGQVLIRIACSTLNYKDGLAVTGRPGVVRKYPMIPGIDFAGTVEESSAAEFRPGDPVVVTGCGTGETMWGGYADLARLDAQYIVPLPKGMTLAQSMAIGTAGFTAMQSLLALEALGLEKPADRPVLVTGASGGVGSIAVAILAKNGYQVAAATGRPENAEYLKRLGADQIVDRAQLLEPPKRPLESERWAAAIDTVGGDTLATVLRTLQARGSVASCGLAGGSELNTTVFPFILRGVNLIGIDSPKATKKERLKIWQNLSADLDLSLLEPMVQTIPLDDVIEWGERIVHGQVRGRTVVEIE